MEISKQKEQIRIKVPIETNLLKKCKVKELLKKYKIKELLKK
jgi:hypothetical protein